MDGNKLCVGSVTRWIAEAGHKDQAAMAKLFDRYWSRMIGLARKKLQDTTTGGDAEDVALAAFASFFERHGAGKYDRLKDREDLLPLLMSITFNKAQHLRQREKAAKRGNDAVRVELEALNSEEPTPEFIAQMKDECGRLLSRLSDEDREIVGWKVEGYTDQQIAGKLECSTRKVVQLRTRIRELWAPEIDHEPG